MRYSQKRARDLETKFERMAKGPSSDVSNWAADLEEFSSEPPTASPILDSQDCHAISPALQPVKTPPATLPRKAKLEHKKGSINSLHNIPALKVPELLPEKYKQPVAPLILSPLSDSEKLEQTPCGEPEKLPTSLPTATMPSRSLCRSMVAWTSERLSAAVWGNVSIARIGTCLSVGAAVSCVRKSADFVKRFLHWHAPQWVTFSFCPTSLVKPFLSKKWYSFAKELLPGPMRAVVVLPVPKKDSLQRLVDIIYLRSVEPSYVLKKSIFGFVTKKVNHRKLWAQWVLSRLENSRSLEMRQRVVPKVTFGLCLGIGLAALLAYVLWRPWMSSPRACLSSDVEKVDLPQSAIDTIVPRIRSYSLFTSRTPDTLLNLKNTVMTVVKEDAELNKLTPAQKEELTLLAIREGMTPRPEELKVIRDLESDRGLLWDLANYTRTGSRGWWEWLTGRSLPK